MSTNQHMSRLEVEAEEERLMAAARSKASHQNLIRLHAGVTKINKLVAAVPAIKDRKERMDSINLALKGVKAIIANKDRRVQGTGALLKRIHNELTSAREAVYASTRPVRLDFSTTAEVVDELAEKIEASRIRAAQQRVEAETADEIKDAAEVFMKHGAETPKVDIGKKPFGVQRAPIVAIANPAFSAIKLKRNGFDAEAAHGYVVIHKQMVLGINRSLLDKRETQQQAAQRVMKLIQKQTGRKMQFATSQAYAYKGSAYYWIVAEEELNRLRRCGATTAEPQVERWGFAFN